MRIGIGYDVHRFAKNKKLILGGTEIPYKKGLSGHSDADVLLHAIIDALLGAAALGDIGQHFPDNDNNYKGISSLLLLKKTANLLSGNGYKIINIDSTIIAEEPKIGEYKEKMRENIAAAVGIEKNNISIKGKTEEGLGFTGKRKGIKAEAICLIKKEC
mgnify:FL=1